MTERASDLLAEVADKLSDNPSDSGQVAAESVRAIEPDLLKTHKDGSVDELVKTSVAFLEILFRSLRPDSRVPWHEYYTVARETSKRYAEKGVPLEALMEGLAVFRRSVIARVTDGGVAANAGLRVGDVVIEVAHRPAREFLTSYELATLVQRGEATHVGISRGGRRISVDLTPRMLVQ